MNESRDYREEFLQRKRVNKNECRKVSKDAEMQKWQVDGWMEGQIDIQIDGQIKGQQAGKAD